MAMEQIARPTRRTSAVILAVLAAVGVSGGCRTTNPAIQRAQDAAAVMIDTRQSLTTANQTVTDCQATLRTLAKSKADLRTPFDAFVAQIAYVRKQADRQRAQSVTTHTQATNYVAARQQDISTISNPALRKAGERRTAEMQTHTQTLKQLYDGVNAAFAVYVKNLEDVQTYLANDLSYGALELAQPTLAASISSGEELGERLRALATHVDLMSNTLSPAPVTAGPWPTSAPVPAETGNPLSPTN